MDCGLALICGFLIQNTFVLELEAKYIQCPLNLLFERTYEYF